MLKEIWYTVNGVRSLAYSYKYTSDGELAEFKNHLTGETSIYAYTTVGDVKSISLYNTGSTEAKYEVTLGYDDRGRLDSERYEIVYLYNSSVKNKGITNNYYYTEDGKVDYADIHFGSYTANVENSYDIYDRLTEKTTDIEYLYLTTFKNSVTYTYTTTDNSTSSQVSGYTSKVTDRDENELTTAYVYTYDNNGNITRITRDGQTVASYVYDNLGQLLSEEYKLNEKSYKNEYIYDDAGNILFTNTYELRKSTFFKPEEWVLQSSEIYEYSNSSWGDRLVSYNGQSITYDEIGNPLTYYNGNNYTFTWEARRLVGATKGTDTFTFTYNEDGIRTSKTKNGITTTYHLIGSQIIAEETSGNITVYLYDESGLPIGFQYRASTYAENVWDTYFYEKNLQGDIVAVYSDTGVLLTTYVYDAWGNFSVSYSNGGASTTATKNPFTYRGYYYDGDLGLYYLNSRYYDAVVGRFISADGYVSTGQGLLGYNMYAYCNNNPVNYVDYYGESAEALLLQWLTSAGTMAAAEPSLIGEAILVGGIIIIGGIWFVEAINGAINFAKDVKTKTPPKSITEPSGNIEVDENGRPVVKPKQQPTEKEGYLAPKQGPKWNKEKGGWEDKYGNVWVPAPTGSSSGHGGGHWDVQSPKGGYTNIHPGSSTPRGGKAPFPRIFTYK